MILLLLACTGPVEIEDCGSANETLSVVVSGKDFARRAEEGQAWGFDLDGHTSSGGDSEGCGIADVTSPDGVEGIDNALSGILPTLEATQAVAVSGLIEDSIRSGELLVMAELTRVDDPMDDACVDFGLWRARGVPLVGTDGQILDHQTFERDPDIEPGVDSALALEGGVFQPQDFEYVLPVQILDVFLTFHMQQAQLHGELDEDGNMVGYFGGAVPLTDFDVLTELSDIGEVAALLEGLLPLAADIDLDQDGIGDAMSIVFEVEGIPAYFFP